MKQHVDFEKVLDLSDEEKEKLFKYFEPIGMNNFKVNPIATINLVSNNLNIGKMIEILEESCSVFNIIRYDDCNGKQWNVKGTLFRKENRYLEMLESELCDALWKAIRTIL